MNYTAFTAVIFSFHNLSIAAAAVWAVVLTAILYGIFLRKRPKPFLFLISALFISFVVGMSLAEKLFHQTPVAIEVIEAG